MIGVLSPPMKSCRRTRNKSALRVLGGGGSASTRPGRWPSTAGAAAMVGPLAARGVAADRRSFARQLIVNSSAGSIGRARREACDEQCSRWPARGQRLRTVARRRHRGMPLRRPSPAPHLGPGAPVVPTRPWMSSASSSLTTSARFTSRRTRRRSCVRSSRSTTRASARRSAAAGFIEYDTDEAAFIDALRLARGMTYKAALAGLPHGGGKSVIIRPKQRFDRVALFARSASSSRTCTALHHRRGQRHGPRGHGDHPRQTKFVTGIDPSHGGSGDPSPFTALRVRRGIERA